MRGQESVAAGDSGIIERPELAIDPSLDLMMWEIGRAYYAYVGLAERILADAKLEEVRPGMGLVLFTLFEQDRRTIKEIAARTQLANSTLSGMLARMEKAGLIERSRDTEDGRLVRVHLTGLRAIALPRRQILRTPLVSDK